MRPGRPRARIRILTVPAAFLLAAGATGCWDPPVREKLLLTLESDGRWVVSVETTFKQGENLKEEETDRIRRAVDLYELGRDPWLKGLRRAGAQDVVDALKGEEENPQGISRTAAIPGVESLMEVMPDAIANFRLIADPEKGTLAIRIVHIDTPESLRDNRRRLEREVEEFAGLGFDLSEKTCDLYDYLAEHPDRRVDVLQALDDDKKIAGMITPEEAALMRDLMGAWDRAGAYGQSDGKGEPPALSTISFSAFDHDFCVKLPVEASEVLGLDREADRKENPETGTTYCAPRLTLDELVAEVWPQTDPPLKGGDLPEDDEALRAAPFTCRRHDDATALELKLWDRILPLPYYELVWISGAPSTAPAGGPAP